jgi:hypothetical protein
VEVEAMAAIRSVGRTATEPSCGACPKASTVPVRLAIQYPSPWGRTAKAATSLTSEDRDPKSTASPWAKTSPSSSTIQ